MMLRRKKGPHVGDDVTITYMREGKTVRTENRSQQPGDLWLHIHKPQGVVIGTDSWGQVQVTVHLEPLPEHTPKHARHTSE